MAPITRVKLRWSGFQGAPGLTVFHFRDFEGAGGFAAEAAGGVARVHTFADTIKTLIPGGVTLQVAPDVESIEETTGELLDVRSEVVPGAVFNNAAAGLSYASAVGAVINWRTNGVRNGRRIRGRSFIVPLSGPKFESNGTLGNDTITTLQNAANALILGSGTPDLGVWARPTRVKDAQGVPTGETLPDGIWYVASSANVPDMGAVLRSRRD